MTTNSIRGGLKHRVASVFAKSNGMVLSTASERNSQRAPTMSEPGSQSAFRVLLVEDNPGDVELVREALEGIEGRLDFHHVERIAEAIQHLASSPIDVVILDLTLPDAVGLEGLEQLRDVAPKAPVVVLTGSLDERLGQKAVSAGAQDYLLKGQVDAQLLRRTLRYAIERQQYAHRSELLAEERAARRAAEEGQRSALLLAEVSAACASSLDYKKTIQAIGEIIVPSHCDWIAFDLAQPGQEVAAESIVHGKGPEVETAKELRRRYRAEHHAPYGAPRVMRTGTSEMYSDITDAMLGAVARDPEHLALLRKLGMRSAIIVPMIARARTIGTISLVAGESGRRYQREDLIFAEEIARGAASTVENARLYREATEAIGVRDEFLSIASHELQTPLTPLKLELGAIRLMLEQEPQDQERGLLRRIDSALRQTDRLSKLIDSLLDVSRIRSGRLSLTLEEVDLRGLLKELCGRLGPSAKSAHCELRLHIKGAVSGYWDKLAIERVIGNLLSNAMKYGAGKPIEISASAENGTVLLSVLDRGIGIAPENVDRIFRPFERAVSARHYGGLGLGLYISRHIIEAHGGSIEVQSSPGEGAKFTVRLPVRRNPPAVSAQHRPEE